MRKINFWCFIVLCVLGGFIGLQEYYRKKIGLGVLATLFFWTGIPCLVAFIESLVWLFRGEEEFDTQYKNL
jgi:TM2 domain-containing membrane protein YozV